MDNIRDMVTHLMSGDATEDEAREMARALANGDVEVSEDDNPDDGGAVGAVGPPTEAGDDAPVNPLSPADLSERELLAAILGEMREMRFFLQAIGVAMEDALSEVETSMIGRMLGIGKGGSSDGE